MPPPRSPSCSSWASAGDSPSRSRSSSFRVWISSRRGRRSSSACPRSLRPRRRFRRAQPLLRSRQKGARRDHPRMQLPDEVKERRGAGGGRLRRSLCGQRSRCVAKLPSARLRWGGRTRRTQTMPMKTIVVAMAAGAALIVGALACSSGSSGSGNGNGGSGGGGSCTDICSHFATLCGAEGSCVEACAEWSSSTSSCIGNAASCGAAAACAESGGGSGSGSGGGSGSGSGGGSGGGSGSGSGGGSGSGSGGGSGGGAGCNRMSSLDSQYCSVYAQSGDPYAYACTGDAVPDSSLSCQGPNVGSYVVYCCNE
jgi:hypothetical protein